MAIVTACLLADCWVGSKVELWGVWWDAWLVENWAVGSVASLVVEMVESRGDCSVG